MRSLIRGTASPRAAGSGGAGSHGPIAAMSSLGVHRLGDVVVGARVETALPFAGHDLAGHRDDRHRLELVERADRAHGVVAVHARHHDVGQHEVDIGGAAVEERDRRASALGDGHLGPAPLEQRGQREDVAEVVVDDEDASGLRTDGRRGRCAGCVPASARACPWRPSRSRQRATAGRSGIDGVGGRRAAVGVVATPAERQEHGERAALAGRARQRDLAAEQTDELTADREPEPGAAVEARGGSVALRERLEDAPLLLCSRSRCRCRARRRRVPRARQAKVVVSGLQPSRADRRRGGRPRPAR